MTIFFTIISGVFVFVLGQIILKLFVEPWQMQRECIAKISNNLLQYSNVYSNPGAISEKKVAEVSIETRKLASEFLASCYRIPAYGLISKSWIFPSATVVKSVQRNLIGLSNSLKDGEGRHNSEMVEGIKSLLKINLI